MARRTRGALCYPRQEQDELALIVILCFIFFVNSTNPGLINAGLLYGNFKKKN
jgi:hypothetical protein